MATTYFRYPVVGSGGGGGGVTSLNLLTGALTLVAGANITITPSGSNITIAAPGGSPGGSPGAVQYNNSGAFGGFGTWSGTNLHFGSQYLNGDGSIGNGASQGVFGVALGSSSSASGTFSVAVGYGAKATAGSSTAVGAGASGVGNYNLVLGSNCSAVNSYSIVIGSANNDSHFPHGYTFGAYNYLTDTVEAWLGILPGATANTPRMILGATVTDDNSSALQVYGAINIGNGNQYLNLDGSIGAGASQGTDAVALGGSSSASGDDSVAVGANATANSVSSTAVGYGASAGLVAVALGSGSSASGNYSVAVGVGAAANSGGSTVVGYGASAGGRNNLILGLLCSAVNNSSIVLGYGNTDSQFPHGYTFGNYNYLTNTTEAWLGILPGATANTPRMILGATVTDDNSSAFQPYGAIKLCDYTTVGTPVKGQIAYNYTTGAITSYNGSAWI